MMKRETKLQYSSSSSLDEMEELLYDDGAGWNKQRLNQVGSLIIQIC